MDSEQLRLEAMARRAECLDAIMKALNAKKSFEEASRRIPEYSAWQTSKENVRLARDAFVAAEEKYHKSLNIAGL